MWIPTLYFVIAPVLPISQFRIGPASVSNLMGVLSVLTLAILFNSSRRRVVHDLPWRILSLIFIASCLIGLVRASAAAYPTVFGSLIRYGIVWAIVTLSPASLGCFRRYGSAWLVGLSIAGVIQIYSEKTASFAVDETTAYSYSRYMQGSEQYELATEMGLYNTHGYMAMSIAAICAFATASLSKSTFRKGWLFAGGCFLIVAERRGGFLSADALVLLGFLLLLAGLFLVPSGSKLKVATLSAAFLIGLGSILITKLDFINVDKRVQSIERAGLYADSSIAARVDLLAVSYRTWLTSPLYGVGLLGWIDDAYQYIGFHSSIVDVPAQLGLVGFIGYFGLLFVALARALRTFRKDTREEVRAWAFMAAIGLVLFLAATIMNPVFLFYLMNETYLLLCGSVVAAWPGIRQISGDKSDLSRAPEVWRL